MKFPALLPFLLLLVVCRNCLANTTDSPAPSATAAPAASETPAAPAESELSVLPIFYGGSEDLDFWYKIPPELPPKIIPLKSVYVNQKFTVFAAFFMKGSDKDEALDLRYAMKRIAPDGSAETVVENEPFNIPSYNGNVLLLPKRFGCHIDGDSDTGVHTLHVDLTDVATGKHATAEAKLEVKKWVWPEGEADLSGMQNTYPHTFDPDMLHRIAFSREIDLESWKEPYNLNIGVVFFLMFGYAQHDFLLAHYREEFATRSPFERKRIQFLLALTAENPIPDAQLTGEEKAWQEKLKGLLLPDAYASLDEPAGLDSLWGEFFATGSYRPVLRLLDALKYEKEADAAGKFLSGKAKAKTKKEKILVFHALAFKTGLWSLQSNCMQNDLAAEYMLYALKNEKLDDNVRNLLAVILSKKWPNLVKIHVSK
jgi:hypothetical protein